MDYPTTITYRGHDVEAETIAHVNLWRGYAPGRELYDTVLRDKAGRYYLRRDFNPGTRTHALSLPAAIIWAADNTPNGNSHPLYLDASNLLTADRGVDDPPPFPYMRWEEWQASDEYRLLADKESVSVPPGGLVLCVRPDDGSGPYEVPLSADERATLEERACADGVSLVEAFLGTLRRHLNVAAPTATAVRDGDTVTVPLTLDLELYAQVLAMGEYDKRGGFSETVANFLHEDVQTWLDCPDKPSPKSFLKRWLKKHPLDQLVTAEAARLCTSGKPQRLDHEATELVDRFLQETEGKYTGGDVINGCVVQLLSMAVRALENTRVHAISQEGRRFAEDEWGIAEENAYDARQRRLGLPAYAGEEEPSQEGDSRPPETAKIGTHPNAVAPPGHHRVFGCYPSANGSRFGFLEIEDESYEHFKRLADKSGLSVGEEIAAFMEAKGSRTVPVFTQNQLSERGRAQVASDAPTALHSLNAAPPEALDQAVSKAVDEARAFADQQPDWTDARRAQYVDMQANREHMRLPGTETRESSPVPIRDVLVNLATDWRIKAAVARATGLDATPFPASHKLEGQADVLEACADALEAAVEGKEGC